MSAARVRVLLSVVLAGGAAVIVLAAIGVIGAGAGRLRTAGSPSVRALGRGTVSVLYAGSLVEMMEERFDPAFQKATGYSIEGFAGGSDEVAQQIRGGVRQGDVFIAAAPSADRELMGAAGGEWVSWYASFAKAPLVLAYNPSTRLGRQLKAGRPWYEAITEKGAIVGRTDPRLDPKGRLTVQALDAAASTLHDGALKAAIKRFPVFPETALVGRLQAGQVEAGFFYTVEAVSAKLASVPLTPIEMGAEYTVSILERARDERGAEAFVGYLLSARGSGALKSSGLTPIKPRFSGAAKAVPAGLRETVGAR